MKHKLLFSLIGLTLLFTAYLAWTWRAWFWPLLTFRGVPQYGLQPHFTTIRPTNETD